MKIKHALLALLFVVGNAQADNEMAYAPNKLGGQIFFTFTDCVYLKSNRPVPNHFYVYSTDSAGNKVADGCFEYKHPFYFVTWNGGGRLSVNVNTVTVLYRN